MANTLEQAQKNKKILTDMQSKPALSDSFTQALVGFLPLIAGLGSSEDTAAVAPVGLQAMQQLGNSQEEDRKREDIVNAQALGLAQRESGFTNDAFKQDQMNQRQREAILSREKIAQLTKDSASNRLDRRIEGQKEVANLRNENDRGVAFDIAEQKEAAKKASDWLSGGKAVAQKSIESLQNAIDNLKSNPALVGRGTGTLPEWATSQKVLDQRQNVQSALLSGVKATFPGAISDKETEIFIKSHYNEQASPEQNIKTLERAITQMKSNASSLEKIASGGSIRAAQTISKSDALKELERRKAARGK